eukprot:1148614-Pelagomonas_calceolata.AAC.3
MEINSSLILRQMPDRSHHLDKQSSGSSKGTPRPNGCTRRNALAFQEDTLDLIMIPGQLGCFGTCKGAAAGNYDTLPRLLCMPALTRDTSLFLVCHVSTDSRKHVPAEGQS